MAFANKTNSSSAEKKYFNVKGNNGRVENVRLISDKVACFTLKCDGASFYNLKVVDGKSGQFIAVPSQKGNDGKYYNQYGLYLSDEDTADIIDYVIAKVQ